LQIKWGYKKKAVVVGEEYHYLMGYDPVPDKDGGLLASVTCFHACYFLTLEKDSIFLPKRL
jgi:hypothetical protein